MVCLAFPYARKAVSCIHPQLMQGQKVAAACYRHVVALCPSGRVPFVIGLRRGQMVCRTLHTSARKQAFLVATWCCQMAFSGFLSGSPYRCWFGGMVLHLLGDDPWWWDLQLNSTQQNASQLSPLADGVKDGPNDQTHVVGELQRPHCALCHLLLDPVYV